ncbi:MAG TPA: tRNA (N6-threonylcarbamoyladenosine(37)-N6)-methyltransferase TrmO [Desulfobulbaceae bacterium]|nr:tRNA (N6-threonylcarbamoyladenosine(37)-N6)-methyltransferase TrmO [Desulfobulbaceae bacterium]
MEEPRLHCIGILHGDITRLADAPKNFSESNRTGILEIYPKYRDGLDGITKGQTIVVLFWLHKADRSILKVHPRGDSSRELRGVFATRSPARPNPIALSELLVQAIDENTIAVSGVDVLDNTPIIDIKKKI